MPNFSYLVKTPHSRGLDPNLFYFSYFRNKNIDFNYKKSQPEIKLILDFSLGTI